MREIQEVPGKVTFKSALSDYFKGYFDFMGRSTRAGYWWSMLAVAVVWFLPFFGLVGQMLIAGNVGTISNGSARIYLIMAIIIAIGLFIPTLALSVRRYRDAGLNGRGAVVLWVINGFASRLSMGHQSRAWQLISALIGLTLFAISVLETDYITTDSDNPLVTFFLRKKAPQTK